jgi:hypothetical protein
VKDVKNLVPEDEPVIEEEIKPIQAEELTITQPQKTRP